MSADLEAYQAYKLLLDAVGIVAGIRDRLRSRAYFRSALELDRA